MKKRRGGFLLGLGLLLLAAGLVLKLVVVPDKARFPDNVDETRTYTGTVSLLNRQALDAGDVANVFLRDVPATIERHVTTDEVDGNQALVHDVSNLKGPDGTTLVTSDDFYTIDRKTMAAVQNFSSNTDVNPAEGLVVGFPIGTEQKNYTGWNDDAGKTVELKFVAKEERAGRTALRFEASSGPEKIVHPGTLEKFPATVSKDQVVPLLPLFGLAPEVIAQLSAFLPLLPAQIPLTYTYEFEAKYWVDPDTGVLLDTEKHDLRKAVVDASGFGLGLLTAPVYDLNYTASEDSKRESANDAKGYANLLKLGDWVPWGLIGLGGLSLLIGLMRKMRSGKDRIDTMARGAKFGEAKDALRTKADDMMDDTMRRSDHTDNPY